MHVIPIPTHQVPSNSRRQVRAIFFELRATRTVTHPGNIPAPTAPAPSFARLYPNCSAQLLASTLTPSLRSSSDRVLTSFAQNWVGRSESNQKQFTKMQLKKWMKPISAKVPKALAASGHTAQVIREPYGVTLIIGPFNGPLILLLDPAITALSADPAD
jgi:hypothetical protein